MENWITERLILRRYTLADASVFSTFRSDPELARLQSWHAPYTLEDATRALTHDGKLEFGVIDEWLQIAIEERTLGVVIGDVAFCLHGPDRLSASIGYTLVRSYQGQGFATEAVSELIRRLGAMGVTTVRADCDVRNDSSIRLLTRLGFTQLPGERTGVYKGETCQELDFELALGYCSNWYYEPHI